MKFRVKAVLPEGQESMEAGMTLLPPAKAVSYAWVYVTALAVALAGFTIGRFRKKGKKRPK